MPPIPRNRRKMRRGFTLIEVMLAMIVFLMMTLMFAAAFPIAVPAARVSNNNAQAAELAQHRFDHLRSASYSNLSSASILKGRGIIDSPQPSGYPISKPAGFAAGSVQYSFTTADALTNYFPPGSTGVVTISPDLAAPSGQVKDITLSLNWTGGDASTGQYTVKTKIANF